MSAALMMANLQAVAHGRLLGGSHGRPAPDTFVAALNRDIRGRFGVIDTPPCSTESLIPAAGYCGTLVPVTARLSSFRKPAKRRPFREVICRWGCLPKQHIRNVELLCRGAVQSLYTPTE